MSTLATVAAVAPWLGLLATVELIFESFRGVSGDKTLDMLWMCGWLSLSLWPTAMGLAVGLTSLWCFRYLTSRLNTFDREMGGGSLDLLNRLTRYRGPWTWAPAIDPAGRSPFSGAASLVEVQRSQRDWRRAMSVTVAALLVAWCLQVERYLGSEWISLDSAVRAAGWYVVSLFGLGCLPAHFVWT